MYAGSSVEIFIKNILIGFGENWNLETYIDGPIRMARKVFCGLPKVA